MPNITAAEKYGKYGNPNKNPGNPNKNPGNPNKKTRNSNKKKRIE
jgi:hypothetical protein